MAETLQSVPKSALPGIRAVALRSGHSFPKHSHDEFGIGLISEGGQRSASGRGIVEAGAGDLITVSPGEVHDGAPLGRTPRSWTMLYVEPERVAEGAAGEGDSVPRHLEFVAPVLSDPALAARYSRLFAIVTSPPGTTEDLAAEEALTDLVVPLLRFSERVSPTAERGLARVIESMRDDPAAAVTLDDLARIAETSRYRLVRSMARRTGLTPFAYLRQLRLDMARRLLSRGMPIAEAAAAAGFADQSHLTRVFVAAYGVTPGAVRTASA